MKGIIYLEDGTVFEGKGMGAKATKVGELVFNTSMVGYEKILTDPSYNGQIITMTYPLIGNYGVTTEDFESDGIYAFGFVVKDLSEYPSNYRNEMMLEELLIKEGIPCVTEIDTRKLTKILRNKGVMKCVITTENLPFYKLKEICDNEVLRGDYMNESAWVTDEVLETLGNNEPGKKYEVAVIDMGIKKSILVDLIKRGCHVKMFRSDAKAEDIIAMNPDGIFLSNGPGDPEDALITDAVKELIKTDIPIFGICMGHQILALANGGSTYKLKFGHRGGNHGVHNLETDRSYITSQNHGYAVSADSFTEESGIIVTELNLNDNTVEGLRHKEKQIFSVQYHPESNPGPRDSGHLFEQFIAMMEGGAK